MASDKCPLRRNWNPCTGGYFQGKRIRQPVSTQDETGDIVRFVCYFSYLGSDTVSLILLSALAAFTAVSKFYKPNSIHKLSTDRFDNDLQQTNKNVYCSKFQMVNYITNMTN